MNIPHNRAQAIKLSINDWAYKNNIKITIAQMRELMNVLKVMWVELTIEQESGMTEQQFQDSLDDSK
jgi:hypothetical protein